MPVAIPIILAVTAVAAVASAAVSASAAKTQGDNAQKIADYNAAIDRNNALVAAQQSQYEADRIRSRNRRIMGSQQAAYAHSGVDINSGSPNDVASDSGIQGEMDALTALYTGKIQASRQLAEADLQTARGQAAQSAAGYAQAGAILGGVSSVGSIGTQYSSYKIKG
jgi:hypothetical protein